MLERHITIQKGRSRRRSPSGASDCLRASIHCHRWMQRHAKIAPLVPVDCATSWVAATSDSLGPWRPAKANKLHAFLCEQSSLLGFLCEQSSLLAYYGVHDIGREYSSGTLLSYATWPVYLRTLVGRSALEYDGRSETDDRNYTDETTETVLPLLLGID
jgi:hypothetical protein